MDNSEYQDQSSKPKRFTKQRQTILEILRGTYSHPDANWVYKKVCKKIPKISLGTVYRNLNILTQDNMIKELACQPNLTRYDADMKPHHHLMCQLCHTIIDVKQSAECDVNKTLMEKLIGEFNYQNVSCEIIFTGICPECANRDNN
jgi:Fe2+ or Zn2+ uptake regulation protein